MKSSTVITFIVILSTSSTIFAGGKHSGGHGEAIDHSTMNHSTMDHSTMSHWMAPAIEAAKPNPIKATQQSIQQGGKLFQQYCMSCHGANGDGNGQAAKYLSKKPANLRVMAGQHPDGDFAYKIKKGRDPMPGWEKTLNDKQIWHVVNFIQTLNTQPVKQTVESFKP